MPDLAASLQRIVPTGTLVSLVAVPLAGAACHALAGKRASAAAARIAGVACVTLTATTLAAHAVVLGRAGGAGHALFGHLAPGARLGALDAGFDLYFDMRAAVACAAACIAALLGAMGVARESRNGQWAALELALGGVLLAVLADGLAAVAIGWTVAAGAWASVFGRAEAREAVASGTRSAAAIALLLLGAAFLHSAFGGEPRFTISRIGSAAPGRDAAVSMAAPDGAQVYVDDSRTPASRAPFTGLAVPAGARKLRIRVGGGTDEHLVRAVLAGGEDAALVPLGPTLATREMDDQIALGAAPAGDRTAGALLALLAAAWLLSLPAHRRDPTPRALFESSRALSAIAAIHLVARAWRLLPFGGTLAIAAAAAAGLAWTALHAASLRTPNAPRASMLDEALERGPARMGELAASMDRWVIDAAMGAFAAVASAASWVAATIDARVVSAPGDAAASGALGMARGVESLAGVPMSRVGWSIVGVAAAALLAHQVWP